MDIARDNVAILEFCLHEILRRESADRQYSWLWHIKEKIARFALNSLYLQDRGPQEHLTAEQMEQIMHDHPLLDNKHTSFGQTGIHIPEHIRDEVHNKVQSFAESSLSIN
jgi:hypothetical protein